MRQAAMITHRETGRCLDKGDVGREWDEETVWDAFLEMGHNENTYNFGESRNKILGSESKPKTSPISHLGRAMTVFSRENDKLLYHS